MKLNDILDQWDHDSIIDPTDLGQASLQEAKLHSKYIRIYVNEKLRLKQIETELKELTLRKMEFYTQGPTKESIELGWKLPAVGKVLKADLQHYLGGDPDISKINLLQAGQEEKVAVLESIIKTIQKRSFQIKNTIDYIKFQSGVG